MMGIRVTRRWLGGVRVCSEHQGPRAPGAEDSKAGELRGGLRGLQTCLHHGTRRTESHTESERVRGREMTKSMLPVTGKPSSRGFAAVHR